MRDTRPDHMTWFNRRLIELEDQRQKEASQDSGQEDAQADGPADTSPIDPIPTPAGDGPGIRYPTADVVMNPSGRVLKVAVANNPAARCMGLQGLGPEMDGFDGMLFAWPSGHRATMTPAKVPYPIHVSYWDSSGTYVDHGVLQPGGDTHTSAGFHTHALEMRASDADGLGIGPEASIGIQAHDSNDGTIPMNNDRP